MTTTLFLAVVAAMLVINVLLWKSGFLGQAEQPEIVADRPVQDAKERRAFLKRLERWREEGKISREEFEHFLSLCQAEWDPRS